MPKVSKKSPQKSVNSQMSIKSPKLKQ